MKQLIPLLLLVAGLTACAGGDEAQLPPVGTITASPTAQATAESEPSATEVPTSPTAAASMAAEERTETEALLKAAALQLEDLPSGFALDIEIFTTNEEAAKGYPDGEEQGLADYTRWGRLLGYEATYSTGDPVATLASGGTMYIAVRPTLYQDSNGAAEAMGKFKERISDPEQRAEFVEEFRKDSNWEDPVLAPLSFAQVGDDTLAFQLTGNMSSSESGLELTGVAQVATIRRGRATGMVILSAAQAPPPVQELEAIVRRFDQRIQEALE